MKFSIRDVLWLTVVVALAVCWGLDRAQLRQAEMSARLEAEKAKAESLSARNMAIRAQAIAELNRAAAAMPSSTAP
jgi:cell division protein FtsB